MIKVNLAKTHSYASTGTQTAIALDQAMAESAEAAHPGVKIVLMLVATVLLITYEKYNISHLESQLAEKEQLAQEIQSEIEKYGSVTTVVQDLIKEKQRLNEQLAIIADISKKRAFKLKAIKLVQESVLEDLWLSELIVDDSQLIFKGLSRTPTSVQRIVKTLGNTDFVEKAMNRELTRTTVGKEKLNAFDIEVTVKP